MIRSIANILKNKLATIDNGLDAQDQPLPLGLNFIDKMAGLVIVGSKTQPTDVPGAFQVSKFPISLDTDYEACISSSCYQDLVPNSKLKGILYFEDLGTLPSPLKGGLFSYKSKLRLVCWVNNKLIQGDNCQSISPLLITKIRDTLEIGYFNSGNFSKIRVLASRLLENDELLFSKYTYPSESVKFLMHPYEAFGIDFSVEYSISANCLPDIVLNPELC